MAASTALENWTVEGHAAIGARVVKHFDGAPYLGQVAGWKGPHDRADGQVVHIARAYCMHHAHACMRVPAATTWRVSDLVAYARTHIHACITACMRACAQRPRRTLS
jgi:hypothetical protein